MVSNDMIGKRNLLEDELYIPILLLPGRCASGYEDPCLASELPLV